MSRRLPVILAATALLLSLGSLLGCRSTGAVDGPSDGEPTAAAIVLARVDGEPLTLENAIDQFLSTHMGHGSLIQGEKAVRELAGRLVEKQVFHAEALALGIDRDPLVLAVTRDFAFKQAEIEYWKEVLDRQITVSDEEVEAFYATTDVIIRPSLIRVAERDRAEALRARVVAGESFAELAAAESMDASKSFGGSLGWVKRGVLPRPLEGPAFALEEPGQLTEVVALDDGFAFLRLEERMTNPERPPKEVLLPQIRNILKNRKEDDLRAELEASIEAEAEIERDDAFLTKEILLATETPERFVARSGDETLTLGGFRDLLNLEAIAKAPPEQVVSAAREIVDEWVRTRAMRRRVLREGFLERPKVVRQVEAFRRSAIHKVLLDRFVYVDIDLKEEQIRAYYEENLATEFTRPVEVRLAHFVVASKEHADTALQRLGAGEPFANLARELSIDPTSHAHGGRVGWIKPGEILPEVESVAFALANGEHGGPIETEVGWFVVKVLERKEPVILPYAFARNVAGRRVLERLRREAYATWARRLEDRARIEISDAGVHAAVAWLERQAAEEARAEAEAEAVHGPPSPSPHAPHDTTPEVPR